MEDQKPAIPHVNNVYGEITAYNTRQLAFQLAARSMEINNSTLPDIIKNAETIYQWLTK